MKLWVYGLVPEFRVHGLLGPQKPYFVKEFYKYKDIMVRNRKKVGFTV